MKIREAKVDKVADFIPEQTIDLGPESGDILVLGWGSTYGVIQSVVKEMISQGKKVAHAHLRYLRPFPHKLDEIISRFDKVVIPEINNGQLSKIIRDKFLIDAISYNKIQGVPITHPELSKFLNGVLAK